MPTNSLPTGADKHAAAADNEVLAEKPGLPRRLAAMFYDSLLVFAISFTATLVVVGIRLLLSPEAVHTGERAITGGYHYFLQLVLLASVGGYFAYKKTQQARAEQDLWAEAVDPVTPGH